MVGTKVREPRLEVWKEKVTKKSNYGDIFVAFLYRIVHKNSLISKAEEKLTDTHKLSEINAQKTICKS